MTKKLITFSLAAAIGALSLTGYSGQTGTAFGAGGGQAGQKVILTFPCIWVGSDSKARVFGEMVAGFDTEYAGKYQVKLEEQTGYDVYRDKIRTPISTGAAPDLFTMQDFLDLELYTSPGKLMDLTDFLAESDMVSCFEDGIIEGTQVDGVNYAISYESTVVPIMYDQKLLEEAGVTFIPTTYDESWDTRAKLKAKNTFPTTQMTNVSAWTSVFWYSYALAACDGTDVYKNGFNGPAFEKVAEIMVKMFQNTSSDAAGVDAAMVNGHFFNERATIYTNGSWILGRIKKESVQGLHDDLVLAPSLSYDGKNGGMHISTTQAYLVAGEQNDPQKAKAAGALLRYVSDPERVVELASSSDALLTIRMDASRITDPLQAEIAKQNAAASFMIGHFQGSVSTATANEFPAALESLVVDDITSAEFVQHLKEVKNSNS